MVITGIFGDWYRTRLTGRLMLYRFCAGQSLAQKRLSSRTRSEATQSRDPRLLLCSSAFADEPQTIDVLGALSGRKTTAESRL